MRSHVFTDARLGRLAGRFVWLEVNGEEERNAPFLEQYPVDAWPTLFVIDPSSGQALVRRTGSSGVAELERTLLDARRASGRRQGPAAAALARADRLNGAGDSAGAEAAYREAIARGGREWSRRARAVEWLVTLLSLRGAPERCVTTAREEAALLPRGPSFATVVSNGVSCALELPAGDPARAPAIAALAPLLEEAIALPGLLADDRAGLYAVATSVATDRGDEADARAVAERWWAFLEEEGERAPNAEARAALDTARLWAAVALGEPERALPALLASERDLPGHLDSPYRVASVYRLMGRHDEALAANGRALALTRGPRRLRVYEQRAAIEEARGNREGARAALAEAVAFAETLPPAQRRRQAQLASDLRARLASLGE